MKSDRINSFFLATLLLWVFCFTNKKSVYVVASPYIMQSVHDSTSTENVTGPSITHQKLSAYNTTGYFFVIENPFNHFHITYPMDKHTKKCHGLSPTNLQAKENKCLLAMNGGPFSFDHPNCLGHIVRDNEIILNQDTTNMDFGLLSNRTWIMGSLKSDEVKAMNIQSLVTGFGWLVKEGQPQVTEEGGLIAPRTMIGTDKDGRLLMFEVDGVENKDIGLTMKQAMDWFLSLGAYNAINLDGGGSSATYYNGKIIDHPTCNDKGVKCVRPVATTICVK